MKVCMLMLSLSAAMAGSAWASGVVVGGKGLGHDCFVAAKIGNVRDGLVTCDKALVLEPLGAKDLAATHVNRGVLLNINGRADAAEADFRQAIASDPSLGDSYINLGSVLIKKQDYGQAVEEINRGLERDTSFAWIGYYDRALAYDFMGRYQDAYHDYKKTLELEPHYAPAEERLKDFKVTNKEG